MTEEQAWKLFFATGLPEAWLWVRQKQSEPSDGHGSGADTGQMRR
jgi:hypothetical protein